MAKPTTTKTLPKLQQTIPNPGTPRNTQQLHNLAQALRATQHPHGPPKNPNPQLPHQTNTPPNHNPDEHNPHPTPNTHEPTALHWHHHHIPWTQVEPHLRNAQQLHLPPKQRTPHAQALTQLLHRHHYHPHLVQAATPALQQLANNLHQATTTPHP